MNIHIKITNAITGQVETDNTVTILDYDYAIAEANHKCMVQAFPDSCVNFFMDNGDFICGMPYNQMMDEEAMDVGLMTWAEYYDKWYQGDLAGCNED